MNKVITILLVIIFSCGCKKEFDYYDIDESLGKVVKMWESYDSDLNKITFYLANDDDYLIKTSLKTFINEDWIFEQYGYDAVKRIILTDSNSKNILIASSYMRSTRDYRSMLAYFLETGKCYIYDKHEKRCVPIIQVNKYFSGYGGGYGIITGRKFYIKNKLFLHMVDGYS